jgi:hypothetical protein
MKPRQIKSVVLFGGAGLVGTQVARQLAKALSPSTIVICGLTRREVEPVVKKIKAEFPNIPNIVGEFGNLFVRDKFSKTSRSTLSVSESHLHQIYCDIFGPLTDDENNISQQCLMTKIIMKYKPDAVIDCVNTATGISYQDIKSCAAVVKKFRDSLKKAIDDTENKTTKRVKEHLEQPLEMFPELNNLLMLDLLLVSQSIPQLIRHVTLLYNALVAADTVTYIKVGTTGTGGMGINIPFTHGEDKPSYTLMAKTAVAFAHTGLLFLLARSQGPSIKEIKPGAMIGHRCVTVRPITKFGQPIKRWESKPEVIGDALLLKSNFAHYNDFGDLKLTGIDTGENGFFTRGEYEAITYGNLMEVITPEEIAHNVLFELCNRNTGHDVIAAIDSSIMDPTYHAGLIRANTVKELMALEKKEAFPSIAIGQLGPPQLSKLLYETYLLKQIYQSLDQAASDAASAEEISKKLECYLLDHTNVQQLITSLGLPILLPDGKTILRGPIISIPESKVSPKIMVGSSDDIDAWAKQGWVDLRPANMEVWKNRIKTITASQTHNFCEGSAMYHVEAYPEKDFKAGDIVGWIIANEFKGYRIK